ncbi:hypothetical protein V1514DRAFT_333376 [Lipomyces japonicus]|uniref:uncharacterized protein n=1 Tax=Lipomyces japonicus TaxID=56871 RepID=UPI0034CFF6FA
MPRLADVAVVVALSSLAGLITVSHLRSWKRRCNPEEQNFIANLGVLARHGTYDVRSSAVNVLVELALSSPQSLGPILQLIDSDQADVRTRGLTTLAFVVSKSSSLNLSLSCTPALFACLVMALRKSLPSSTIADESHKQEQEEDVTTRTAVVAIINRYLYFCKPKAIDFAVAQGVLDYLRQRAADPRLTRLEILCDLDHEAGGDDQLLTMIARLLTVDSIRHSIKDDEPLALSWAVIRSYITSSTADRTGGWMPDLANSSDTEDN